MAAVRLGLPLLWYCPPPHPLALELEGQLGTGDKLQSQERKRQMRWFCHTFSVSVEHKTEMNSERGPAHHPMLWKNSSLLYSRWTPRPQPQTTVWDLRTGSAFIDLKHHEDYISCMAVDQAKKILLTASGDGTMGVFNLKRRRFELLSEFQNGDLTSVVLMKRGRKVVCGSSEGTVFIFNWDGFGATSDCFAMQAESVDCIVPMTDSIMCTASMDGYIRAINLMPNRVLGCVGQHVGEPIEQIAKSRDVRFLASCGHDELIKFWDISKLPAMMVSDYRKRKKKDGRLVSLSKKALGGNDFFSGLVEEPEKKKKEEEEEEEEEDDSDSDSD